MRNEGGPTSQRTSTFGWLALLACGLLFVGLAVATTLTWEPCHDEGVTFDQAVGHVALEPWPGPSVSISALHRVLAGEAGADLTAVAHALHDRGMHPPAYYFLINTWVSLLGSSPVALRAPSYGLGLLALVGIWWLARRTVPAAGSGEWAALLLVTSPWFQSIATYARPYCAMVTLTILSTAVLLGLGSGAGRVRTPRGYAAFVVLSVLGLYTLYHYLFVLAAQLLWLLALTCFDRGARRGRALGVLVAVGLAIVVGFAPWLPTLERHLSVTGGASWYFTGTVPLSDVPHRLGGLLRRFALGSWAAPARWPLAAHAFLGLAGATSLLLVASFARPGPLRGDRPARLFWLLGPTLVGLVYAADLLRGTHTLFVSKVAAGLFPLLVIAVVRAWSRAPRWAGVVGLGLWSLVFAGVTVGEVRERARSESSYESLVAHLRRNDRPDHLVALSTEARGHLVPLLLLSRAAGVENVRVAYVRGPRLVGFARAVCADEDLARLTFVNIDEPKPASPVWTTAALDEVRTLATRAGWKEEAPDLREPTPTNRVFTLVEGAAVRYRQD